jgi:hypothetical protein
MATDQQSRAGWRLEAEVELGAVARAQPLHERHILGEDPRRHELEVRKVGVVQLRHLRVLHLDDHALAARQRRPVRLRDRGGADRPLLKLVEERGHRRADRRLDDRAHLSERPRRHAVLQRPQRRDVRVVEDARANGGDELPELDVDAAKAQNDVDGARGGPLVELLLPPLELCVVAPVESRTRLQVLKLGHERRDGGPEVHGATEARHGDVGDTGRTSDT